MGNGKLPATHRDINIKLLSAGLTGRAVLLPCPGVACCGVFWELAAMLP